VNRAANDPLPPECCGKCMYSQLQRPPGQLMSVRFCKALPPTAVMAQTEQGIGAIPVWPPVQDGMHCFQFEPLKGEAEAPSPIIGA
jgi:hypothetical protein